MNLEHVISVVWLACYMAVGAILSIIWSAVLMVLVRRSVASSLRPAELWIGASVGALVLLLSTSVWAFDEDGLIPGPVLLRRVSVAMRAEPYVWLLWGTAAGVLFAHLLRSIRSRRS